MPLAGYASTLLFISNRKGVGSNGGRKKVFGSSQDPCISSIKAYAISKLNLETVAVDSTLIDSKKVANLVDTSQ
jgi:hypothetical protein